VTPEEALAELDLIDEHPFVSGYTMTEVRKVLRAALQTTSDQLAVGDVLEDREGGGYCGNAFGDQNWCDRTVVGIGPDWVAARRTDGIVVVANVDPASLIEYREPR
jgi:hypothetical protein